jgi:hypothetical protein
MKRKILDQPDIARSVNHPDRDGTQLLGQLREVSFRSDSGK